jgi:hypothetical protein
MVSGIPPVDINQNERFFLGCDAVLLGVRYITTVSVCNLYSYMFRYFHVIIREQGIDCKLTDDDIKMS